MACIYLHKTIKICLLSLAQQFNQFTVHLLLSIIISTIINNIMNDNSCSAVIYKSAPRAIKYDLNDASVRIKTKQNLSTEAALVCSSTKLSSSISHKLIASLHARAIC